MHCFPQKTDPNQLPFFVETRGNLKKAWPLKDREGSGNKDEKSVNGTQIFHWEVSTGKMGLPFEEFCLFQKISGGTGQKGLCSIISQPEFLEFFAKWKMLKATFAYLSVDSMHIQPAKVWV